MTARPRCEALEDRTALTTSILGGPSPLLSPQPGALVPGYSPGAQDPLITTPVNPALVLPPQPPPPPPGGYNPPPPPGIELDPMGVHPVILVSSGATAKRPFTIAIVLRSCDGETCAGYRGTVRITASAGLGLPSSYTFNAADAGSHSFTVTVQQGGYYSVRATDTANNRLSVSKVFHVKSPPPPGTAVPGVMSAGDPEPEPSEPAPTGQDMQAAQLAIETNSTRVKRGRVVTFTVLAYDATGQVDANFAGTVSLSSTDRRAAFSASDGWGAGVPVSSYTFTAGDAGVKTFSVVLKGRGSRSLQVADLAGDSLGETWSLVVR